MFILDSISPDQYRDALDEAKEHARPEISDFLVGAVAVGKSGKAYLGCNLEFKNQPVSQTVHAEQFAIALAKIHHEEGLERLIVSEMPCGHCRQFLLEINQPDLPITVIHDDHSHDYTLSQLMPFPFELDPNHAGLFKHDPLVLEFIHPANLKELGDAALNAASHSYAPYTKTYGGVAIQTQDGMLFHGGVIESGAFNPTLPALQSALIHIVSEGEEYTSIKAALLVEPDSGTSSYSSSIWTVVKALSPMAQVEFATVKLA